MATRDKQHPTLHPLKTRLNMRLFALWNLLTEPHGDLTLMHDRQQARMLAAIHLPLPLLLLLFFLSRSYGYSTFASSAGWLTLMVSLLTIVSYALSRTRSYRLGVYGMIGAVIALIVASIAADSTGQALPVMPLYFAHVVILASLFLSVRSAVFLAVATFCSLILLGIALPAAEREQIAAILRFLSTLNILIIISTVVRAYHERQIARNTLRLRESEARYRTLFEETFEPITIHDKGYVVAVNPAMEKFSGFTNAEIKGHSLLNFVHPDSRGQIVNGTVAGAEGLEVKLVGKDGRVVTAQIFTKPILYHGREMRMVSVRDLTTQKVAEAARLENALTQDRQDVLQKLIRNLSHDFRTPLAVIKTSLYMLERSTADPSRHHKHLDIVHAQTNRLQEMMEDFIALARLDYVRKSDMTVELADIDRTLQSMVQEHQALAAKRGVTLIYHACDDHQQRYVDRDALKRIAKSLVSNALLYTPSGGRVEVAAQIDDTQLLLTVVDNGVGISPDAMPHVFEPFYRGDPTRSTETGGAGLGLTIAQRLVAVLGGTISAQSEVGVGSSFRVTLPLSQPEQDDSDPELLAEPLH